MDKTSNTFKIDALKGLLIGVSVCLASILVFALVLKFTTLTPFWIKTVNQLIKLISVIFACIVSVKGERGFLKGALVGFLVIAVTYLLFGLISGGLTFGIGTLFEAIYGIIIGALGGIISVNLKK